MKLHDHDEIIINVSYQQNERHSRDDRFEGSNSLLHILFELIYCFLFDLCCCHMFIQFDLLDDLFLVVLLLDVT